jgi:hypothetical protein
MFLLQQIPPDLPKYISWQSGYGGCGAIVSEGFFLALPESSFYTMLGIHSRKEDARSEGYIGKYADSISICKKDVNRV